MRQKCFAVWLFLLTSTCAWAQLKPLSLDGVWRYRPEAYTVLKADGSIVDRKQNLPAPGTMPVPSDSGAEEIIPAAMAAYAGFVFLDPAYAAGMVEQVRVPSTLVGPTAEHLTPRELEILGMLADGLGNREIASRLGLSDHTVKYHISSILDKLGAATRTEAVTLGLRLGLILL